MPKFSISEFSLAVIAFAFCIFSVFIGLYYSSQPPLDAHSFRQTQTALTAYWFIKDGISLAYQTPVAGYPWSIPFEFPLYQAIVALISDATGQDLNATGRLASNFFLFVTIFPVFSIVNTLKLQRNVYWIFIALYFSMPLHLYWGRSFMIETATLFYGVATISFFLSFLLRGRNAKAAIGFMIFATLCVLQKATTALPIFVGLGLIFLISEIRKSEKLYSAARLRSVVLMGAMFVIPLSIGVCWVAYTDLVKSENGLGSQLTSQAIGSWNWGTLDDRLSLRVWRRILWNRLFAVNFGAVVGLIVLVLAMKASGGTRLRQIIVGSLLMAALPILFFPNLHFIHEYYQVANAAFICFALAVSLGAVLPLRFGERAPLIMFMLILAINLGTFVFRYLPVMANEGGTNNRDIAIGQIIKTSVPVGGQFVAFGNDWSSSFAYFSERKSFTVPEWFKDYEKVIAQPENYVEPASLGAVISCPALRDVSPQIHDWAQSKENWKLALHSECLIATPELVFNFKDVSQIGCQASEFEFDTHVIGGNALTHISGWLIPKVDQTKQLESLFLRVQKAGADPVYFNAMQAPRADINKKFGLPDTTMVGFSRLFGSELAPGDYSFDAVYVSDGKAYSCSQPKHYNAH